MQFDMATVVALGLGKHLGRTPTAEELCCLLAKFANEPVRRQRELACGAAAGCEIPVEMWGWDRPPEVQLAEALSNGFHDSQKEDVARWALETLSGRETVAFRVHAGRILIRLLWDNPLKFGSEVREELASGLDEYLEQHGDSVVAKILKLTIAELASQSAKKTRRSVPANRLSPSVN